MRSPAELHPDIARELRAAFEQRPTHPTLISADLFERARANGFNMRGYVMLLPASSTWTITPEAAEIIRNMRC